MRRIREWWKHLGYCWGGNRGHLGFWSYGIRPWRGAPFFWFCIDTENCDAQSDKHRATCEECRQRPETELVSETDRGGIT